MPRPVTLFTGQWADMPLEDLARKAREFGYGGLELACWGDHFDVTKAVEESGYCAAKRDALERHGAWHGDADLAQHLVVPAEGGRDENAIGQGVLQLLQVGGLDLQANGLDHRGIKELIGAIRGWGGQDSRGGEQGGEIPAARSGGELTEKGG